MDIIAGIAAATQGLNILKTVREIDKNFDAATYRSQLADATDALSNAKLALIDAREELAKRDKEIERLQSAFEAKGKLVKGEGDYNYFPGDNGLPLGFPVCPGCEAEGRVVQLKQDGPTETARCPSCDKSHKPVTCYLADGTTLREDELRRRAEGYARATAALEGRTRGRNSWMV